MKKRKCQWAKYLVDPPPNHHTRDTGLQFDRQNSNLNIRAWAFSTKF